MTNDFISIPEIAERLCLDPLDALAVRTAMLKNGVKMFRHGGIYVRKYAEQAIEKELSKCLLPEKSGSSIMSGVQFVLENKRSKSKNTAQDLLKQKMSMATL